MPDSIPRGTDFWQPSTWMPWLFGPEQVQGAAVVCPNGHAMSIGGGPSFGSCHQIMEDGQVIPSIVCHSCSWHVIVALADWQVNG
jgi:hypothetical protein